MVQIMVNDCVCIDIENWTVISLSLVCLPGGIVLGDVRDQCVTYHLALADTALTSLVGPLVM